MRIQFDEQDLIDSVCVAVAARANRGNVEGSEPNRVTDIKFIF